MSLNSPYQHVCRQHRGSCPESCWVRGCTALSFYDGHLVYARTFYLPEAAAWFVSYNQQWTADKIASYEKNCLAVPDAFYKWEYRLWDGTNHAAHSCTMLK